MANKIIYIYAFLAGNLGDDLMVRVVCARYPYLQFVTFADACYKKVFNDIKNLRVYAADDFGTDRKGFFSRIAGRKFDTLEGLIRSADSVIHVGVSVFTQHGDDWSEFYNADVRLLDMSRHLFVMGANFGPYTNDLYLRQYHDHLARYDGVCFRDTYSRKLFKDLTNVEYAPDLVFNYNQQDIEPDTQAGGRNVVFSVISLTERTGKYDISQYSEIYLSFMTDMATACIDDGHTVTIAAFCKGQGDTAAAEEIVKRLADRGATASVIEYDSNMSDCIKAFSKAEMVVATRFHAVILGWLFGKRVMPVIYSTKTRHLLEDNQVDFYFDIPELAHADVQEAFCRLKGEKPFDPAELKRAAGGQFKAFDKYLKQE